MATFFALSGITGCTIPTGTTIGYDMKYNKDLIISYYKKDYVLDFNTVYTVVCVFGNHHQQFTFDTSTDRDTFYNTL